MAEEVKSHVKRVGLVEFPESYNFVRGMYIFRDKLKGKARDLATRMYTRDQAVLVGTVGAHGDCFPAKIPGSEMLARVPLRRGRCSETNERRESCHTGRAEWLRR